MLNLNELFSQYLRRQAAARNAGFKGTEPTEIVPFEAVPVQPVEPRLAWKEALHVLHYYGDHQPNTPLPNHLSVPPDWAALVSQQDPEMGLAFCLGNFPQSVRNLNPLLQSAELSFLRPGNNRPVSAPSVLNWVDQVTSKAAFPETLLALGVLRLAKQFGPADELLQNLSSKVPARWQPAWSNEQAALAWHSGRPDVAKGLWQSQEESVPALFNRGMTALFSDNFSEARASLTRAVDRLPEDNSWHHLGKLYLALAEMRSR